MSCLLPTKFADTNSHTNEKEKSNLQNGLILSLYAELNPSQVNSLLNDRILAMSKTESIYRLQIYTQVMISVCEKVGNIVSKGENAGDQHFLFP